MSKVDMNFVKPFVDGTIYTMKVQCGFDASHGRPFLKSDINPMTVDIAGIVGVVSEKFKGTISICFPEKTFLAIMKKMLDEEYSSITKEVEDGAGELMNIIFGFAKKKLNEQGHNFQKSLPSVITGANIKVSHVSSGPIIILPFESELGPFQLAIGIETETAA